MLSEKQKISAKLREEEGGDMWREDEGESLAVTNTESINLGATDSIRAAVWREDERTERDGKAGTVKLQWAKRVAPSAREEEDVQIRKTARGKQRVEREFIQTRPCISLKH